MSTLKVNKLRDTAGSADAITLDPNGGAVLAGVTTVTSVKVGAAVTISESGIEASGIGITCANINGAQIGGRRNLIINGAMNVAQRGTSSTTTALATVDRIYTATNGVDEAPTFTQSDVSSGTTPYTSGFRKTFRVTNGNQTSGAGTSDRIEIMMRLEAQDIANSGWNYTSTSSFITLSFWVKSSVAQNFYGRIQTQDGTAQRYAIETGSLTADTWTKITKTIPGNSNLQFDNNVNEGLRISLYGFLGTDYTDSSSLNTWAASATGNRTPDNTSTWYTTNDATFEITGMQLEVGAQATAFEHRSYGEELQLCARYYQKIAEGNGKAVALCFNYSTQYADWVIQYPMGSMRASPSFDQVTGADYYYLHGGSGNSYLDGAFLIEHGTVTQANVYFDPDAGLTAGGTGYLKTTNNSSYLALTAEL